MLYHQNRCSRIGQIFSIILQAFVHITASEAQWYSFQELYHLAPYSPFTGIAEDVLSKFKQVYVL